MEDLEINTEYIVYAIAIIFFLAGFVIGHYVQPKDLGKTCDLDMKQLEKMYEGGFFNYKGVVVSEQDTIGEVYGRYQHLKPFSETVVKSLIEGACK